MATKRSQFYDYYWYSYHDWGMGEQFVRDGASYGLITNEEADSIIAGNYISEKNKGNR